jgi:acyl-homoserine lactone acylase PvdQ
MTTCTLVLAAVVALQNPADVARWERQAQHVTITRDDWGIPHVDGRSDADAVFGMLYAQAEDDFHRIETNYLNAMGRLAEAEGESAIIRDLRMKLFVDPDSLRAQYAASPGWLRRLMDAFADGLNYYLYKHPAVRPRVITRFEPWMALSFTEGSIGGDIERVNLRALEAFYAGAPTPAGGGSDDAARDHEPGGSNGIAIAPALTRHGRALLLINPHTSFFFRAELQVTSDEGLNAYGAVTWGQFFVYQGFNERAGWMHTSSGVDNIDEYLETVVRRDGRYHYRYGAGDRPVTVDTIVVPYRTATGMDRRVFTVYRTHHGPVVRAVDGAWVTVRLMHTPVQALTQSYTRTKATTFDAFRRTMDLHTNSSNNTVYADGDGTIAYFHANFIPRRDARFDWTQPVQGRDSTTEWGPVLSVDESPLVVNPANGWLYNANDAPWFAAGPHSPRRDAFPAYVETGGETSRGRHAVMVLDGRSDWTVDKLRDAAYDSYLPSFAVILPPLLRAWDSLPAGDPLKPRLADQVRLLRAWDLRWGTASVATSLAIAWGDELESRIVRAARAAGTALDAYMASRTTAAQRLQALAVASDSLHARFGTWRVPWGEINRFQRLTGDIVQPFADSGASLPVGFTASRWGSLAAFGAASYKGSKRLYGTRGNSFVAIVEFGDSVRARAITAGGQSGDPRSPHFNDQAARYATGHLRDVYFYRHQLEGHTERRYHPGQ